MSPTKRKVTKKKIGINPKPSAELVQRSGVAMLVSRGMRQDIDMVNDKFTRLFGYTIEDMPDISHWWALAYPDKAYREAIKTEWQARVAKAITNHSEIEPMEAKVRCKDETERYIEFHFSCVGDINLVSFVDVTERKRAEIALRESEERFRLVANTAPVMIWMSGPDKLCTYFNKPWLDFTGRSIEQELGNGWAEGVHPEDLQKCIDTYIQCFDRREKFAMEYRLRHHDREYRWILDIGVPRFNSDGSFAGYIGIGVDVTERRHVEGSLRESEERFRLAAQAGKMYAYEWDVATDIVVRSADFSRVLGSTLDVALTRRQLLASIHPDDRARFEASVSERTPENPDVQMSYRVVRPDGSVIWLEKTAHALFDGDGKMVRTIGMVADVTERRRAEETLRESEEKFRNVFEDSGVGKVIVSTEGRFIAANKAFCDCLGYVEDELLGKTVESITLSEDWPAFYKKLQQALIEKHGFKWAEKRCLHKSGRIVHTESSTSLILDRNGAPQYFVGEVLDVTKRKEALDALSGMTRKLVEAQEQERTRIARELHDDVNQRLALLAVELEQLRDNPSRVRSHVQELQKRITDIGTDIQSVAHDLHSSNLEYLGIAAAMRSWCKEFSGRQKLEIDFRHDARTPLPTEIGMCLFRVLQEALHNAAKHSGVKGIRVQLREKPGEMHLVIVDSGRGFDIEAVKRGSGLGLTSMQERVRLVNGTIRIESRPMGGTTIHVLVPIDPKYVARPVAV